MNRLRRGLLPLLLVAAALHAQSPRFLDHYVDDGHTLLLGVCYPTTYALESLIALRDQGLLPTDNFRVVGLYHEAERSDYAGARQWAEDHGLDWMVYHEVQGALTPETLWGENGCSREFETVLSKVHGLILFGGADVPPYIYGEKTLLLTGISTPVRSFFEASLVFHLLGGSQNPAHPALLENRPDFPLLGICLGEQTLNVGTGGTLIQDIWFQRYGKSTVEAAIALGPDRWHNNPWAKLYPEKGLLRYTMHPIRLKAGGKLVTALGLSAEDRPWIVSSHHQMVDKLGRNLRVIATSMDGKVPEAIEHAQYPNVLGVQFHPEFDTLYDPDYKAKIRPDDAPFSLLSVLENNPPSLAFHRSLWRWFVDRLQEQRSRP